MKNIILSVLYFTTLIYGQSAKINLYINSGVDTLDQNITAVAKTWEKYLNSNPDSSYDNPYWLPPEMKKYKSYDLINHTWFSPSLHFLLRYFKPTLLSISEYNDHYVIRTLFANAQKSGCNILAITQYAAVQYNGIIKICNILPFNTVDWQKEKVGSIQFIFPKSHTFNPFLAGKLNQFIDSLTAVWKIKVKPTEYYIADNIDVVAKALGMDYKMGEGNKIKPGGFTDVENRIVYAGGSNEWYPHEFVHIYINPLFRGSNSYFLEGYATLTGGSGGKTFSQLLKEVNRYLKKHPEMDALHYTGLNYFTGPHYTIGSLLCRMALDKGGLALLKQLMHYGPNDDNLYQAIYDIFGVAKKDINSFIRTKLDEFCAKQ